MIRGASLDRADKRLDDRQMKLSARLLLAHKHHTVADMLAAHADDVRTALRRVEQKRQGQMGTRPRKTALLKPLAKFFPDSGKTGNSMFEFIASD